MAPWVQDWIRYLQSEGGLVGIPLAVGGLVLMFGGWRLWRGAVPLSFAVIGALFGAAVAKPGQSPELYACLGAVLLGAASVPLAQYSVIVLGGVIGAGIVCSFASSMGIEAPVLWVVGAIALIGCSALSLLNRRQVVIIVTSFEGAILILSAAVALLSEVPGLYGFFRSVAYKGGIFLPFAVLVPTVIGTLVQLADLNRKDGAVT